MHTCHVPQPDTPGDLQSNRCPSHTCGSGGGCSKQTSAQVTRSENDLSWSTLYSVVDLRMRVHAAAYAYVRACAGTRVNARACVRVRVRVHVCVRTCPCQCTCVRVCSCAITVLGHFGQRASAADRHYCPIRPAFAVLCGAEARDAAPLSPSSADVEHWLDHKRAHGAEHSGRGHVQLLVPQRSALTSPEHANIATLDSELRRASTAGGTHAMHAGCPTHGVLR